MQQLQMIHNSSTLPLSCMRRNCWILATRRLFRIQMKLKVVICTLKKAEICSLKKVVICSLKKVDKYRPRHVFYNDLYNDFLLVNRGRKEGSEVTTPTQKLERLVTILSKNRAPVMHTATMSSRMHTRLLPARSCLSATAR
mmetsp:Transcript_1522/g.5215  ORF Transcript_1522/g.5215 Transcript_1522/m.5215 type:complete len:141 (-) Transcript_1522:1133-1555(-)